MNTTVYWLHHLHLFVFFFTINILTSNQSRGKERRDDETTAKGIWFFILLYPTFLFFFYCCCLSLRLINCLTTCSKYLSSIYHMWVCVGVCTNYRLHHPSSLKNQIRPTFLDQRKAGNQEAVFDTCLLINGVKSSSEWQQDVSPLSLPTPPLQTCLSYHCFIALLAINWWMNLDWVIVVTLIVGVLIHSADRGHRQPLPRPSSMALT